MDQAVHQHGVQPPAQAEHAPGHVEGHAEGQQHPIKLYLMIWVLLFVFSAFSYMVDYFQLQGALRWTLILLFMFLKASFIVAVFMHMAWERLALKLAILVPPLTLLVLIGLMAIEGDYTFLTRLASFVK
ncbi:cytochrome C oxidase subunit IV family protein [Steroidobacter sp.]|uniref:cytochrome C oxidase subunit IV family protein n=1 Tax=Steroidobacter sp. TaxID=1978227 RepID=UPI001A3DF7F2|nr:cytochrome C oxidase subunit IV family protein [Steroidobacter sp.]MBL8268202.1 cytochrome C oxidase subunit IV family protein [Steroidobacter sp.]